MSSRLSPLGADGSSQSGGLEFARLLRFSARDVAEGLSTRFATVWKTMSMPRFKPSSPLPRRACPDSLPTASITRAVRCTITSLHSRQGLRRESVGIAAARRLVRRWDGLVGVSGGRATASQPLGRLRRHAADGAAPLRDFHVSRRPLLSAAAVFCDVDDLLVLQGICHRTIAEVSLPDGRQPVVHDSQPGNQHRAGSAVAADAFFSGGTWACAKHKTFLARRGCHALDFP